MMPPSAARRRNLLLALLAILAVADAAGAAPRRPGSPAAMRILLAQASRTPEPVPGGAEATLSPLAQAGKEGFARHCAACHGLNASGTDTGPPLVHPIYKPSHHADAAFLLAVLRGVRQHHWMFGNMPPLPQVSAGEIPSIIRYVRKLQEANGIQ